MFFELSLLLHELLKGSQTLSRTKQLHALIITAQLSSDSFYATRVIRLYAINGVLTYADNLFDQIPHRTVYLWNSIIRAHARNCKIDKALNLFNRMLRTQQSPDSFTFACISRACSEHSDLTSLKIVHCLSVIYGFGRDLILGSALVSAYAKFGSINQATKVFNEISMPDIVLCNSMISSYGSCGFCDEAVALFGEMRRQGLHPDGYTLVGLVLGLSHLKLVLAVHGYCMKNSIYSFTHVGTVLVAMYSKFNCLSSAEKIFRDSIMPDLVAWSTLVTGYYECGHYTKALELFREMNLCGKKADRVLLASCLAVCAGMADIYTGKEIHGNVYRHGLELDVMIASALVDMYSKCGSIQLSILVLDNLGGQNVVCYNSAILGLGLNGRASDAFEVFEKMLDKNLKPDKATFSALLCACSNAGLLEDGWDVFRRMRDEFGVEAETEHYVYMVRLLAMCGRLEEAYEVIRAVKEPIDFGIWGALLSSCGDISGDHGMVNVAAVKILRTNPDKSAYKVMLSNIYAGDGRWVDVEKLRGTKVGGDRWKIPAISWCAIP